MIKSFDIDGVITVGIHPGPEDVIITGRSIEELPETLKMLRGKGIENAVYFNPLPYAEKTRLTSGMHKARIITELNVARHFEDDPIQWEIIERRCPGVEVIKIVHDLTEKENVRYF